MNYRQLGTLKVSNHFIKTDPGSVAKVFAMINFVPVRAEMLFAQDAIEYVGISDRFAELPEGDMAPEYDLKITKEGDEITVDVQNAQGHSERACER